MGMIILLAAGALLGWLGAIILRREDARDVRFHIAAGAVGAVAGGALTNSVSIFGGLSAHALMVAVLGSVVAIALLNVIRFAGTSGPDVK